jgi:serine/threonine-protein kinase HipA
MIELSLDVRLDGFSNPIGSLSRTQNGGLLFRYHSLYLEQQNAVPLSMSLPLATESYDDILTRGFFNNLLQERDAPLEDVMEREGITRDDIAGLLIHLGKDCAGAISVLPEGAPATKVPGDLLRDYQAISTEKLAGIVKALNERKRLPDGLQDPSPLAGVQSKISLTILPSGEFAIPNEGTGAPTTHILKVPDRERTRDAKLEDTALNLARLCEFDTAEASSIAIAGIETLVVTRFDRTLDEQGRVIRIHQEDFAQALGLPPSLKYERRGTTERRFDAYAINNVLNHTIDPSQAKIIFIKSTIFDLLVGNVDAHAKNHALLYRKTGRPELSPRYDILPTRLDAQLTDDLPYKIGNAANIHQIAAADFSKFLSDLGISNVRAQTRLTAEIAGPLAEKLAESLQILQTSGMKDLADLIASNMRQLLPELGLPVPEAAQNRDAFIQRGGGWLWS